MVDKTILITGSQGFVGSYLCSELLNAGYIVIGVDNYSKYGRIVRAHDRHYSFTFCFGDVTNTIFFNDLVSTYKPNIIIGLAAKNGGINFYHEHAYDLLAENERIIASTFDAAISAYSRHELDRVLVASSSMVYDNAEAYPTPEHVVNSLPPSASSYGFQKLAVEYFAESAYEQYRLPYQIIRPFNCVGVGEDVDIPGKQDIVLRHVLPDLVQKIMSGQNPLHIFGNGHQTRCYINGKDLARGIRLVMESSYINQAFNISSSTPVTVLELAKAVWEQLNPGIPFNYVSDAPFEKDVYTSVADTKKIESLLGFRTEISLEESISEVIKYFKTKQ